MAKTLVVYYSWTGHVEKIAKELAKELGADTDKIEPVKGYEGKEGYNRAGKESMFGKKPDIKSSKDPSAYDLVIVGSPMWAFSVSSPVRSYISQNKDKMKKAAFYSSSGSPFPFALWSMERTYGKKAVSKMKLREGEIDRGEYKEKLKRFIEEIKKA